MSKPILVTAEFTEEDIAEAIRNAYNLPADTEFDFHLERKYSGDPRDEGHLVFKCPRCKFKQQLPV